MNHWDVIFLFFSLYFYDWPGILLVMIVALMEMFSRSSRCMAPMVWVALIVCGSPATPSSPPWIRWPLPCRRESMMLKSHRLRCVCAAALMKNHFPIFSPLPVKTSHSCLHTFLDTSSGDASCYHQGGDDRRWGPGGQAGGQRDSHQGAEEVAQD